MSAVRRPAILVIDHGTSTLMRDDPESLISALDKAEIFECLPMTGSMWIEQQTRGRVLCVQERCDDTVYEVGCVADEVK